MEYSINQPAVYDTKKNIKFVILPYDIFILPERNVFQGHV